MSAETMGFDKPYQDHCATCPVCSNWSTNRLCPEGERLHAAADLAWADYGRRLRVARKGNHGASA